MDIGKFNESLEIKKVKIDAKDRKIISLLSINARMPLTKIAAKVGLSRDSVNYRINRLIKKNVILSFYPIISLRKFGYSMFHVFLSVDETKPEQRKQLIEHLKKSNFLLSLIEYSDRWDFEVVMVAKNLKQFDTLITELVSMFPHVILEKDKYQIIKSYHFNPLPKDYLVYEDIYYEKDEDAMVEVDEIDIKILQLLCEDCRKSTYEIAPKVNLSADAVGYRIKNLVKNNIIKKFTIMVNLSMLEYHWYTFAAEIRLLDKHQESKFVTFVKYNKVIIRAMKVLGAWDLLLYMVARNPRDFHATVKEIKSKFADIITNYLTLVGYKEHYFNPFPGIVYENAKPFK